MKKKLLILNIALFLTSISILLWNYSIYKEIDPYYDKAIELYEESTQTFDRINKYKEYKVALRKSKMTQDELISFLEKYPNLNQRLIEINRAFEEEYLLTASLALRVLRSSQNNEQMLKTKNYMAGLVKRYHSEELSTKSTFKLTENQKKFKIKYDEYFSQD